MAVLIVAAILLSAMFLCIFVYFIYKSCSEDINDGWLGMFSIGVLIMAFVFWIMVADYDKPTLEHTVKDAVSVQVDTTFIVHLNKVDTLYTIVYEEVNEDSREYKKPK